MNCDVELTGAWCSNTPGKAALTTKAKAAALTTKGKNAKEQHRVGDAASVTEAAAVRPFK